MKLKHILTEGVSQGDSNNLVYNMVLSHIKTDKETMSDIKDKMFNTDEFWVDDLDQVNKALHKDVDEAIDAIFTAAESVGDSIKDHYANIWNHAPGFKRPKIEFDMHSIPYEEALETVKKAAPDAYAAHLEYKETARKAAASAHKQLIKSLQPLLPTLAQTIISKYEKGWTDYLKWLKAHPNDYETKTFTQERKLDISAMKTGKDLASAVKKSADDANIPNEWMHDTYEMLYNGDILDEIDRETLSSIRHHSNTAKKLWAMVSPKVSK